MDGEGIKKLGENSWNIEEEEKNVCEYDGRERKVEVEKKQRRGRKRQRRGRVRVWEREREKLKFTLLPTQKDGKREWTTRVRDGGERWRGKREERGVGV